jgi:hypothetical protein
MLSFHQKYFWPNNAILAVVGDVEPGEAFASVRRVFADWQRKDIGTTTFPEPPQPTRRIVVVNKPDAVQTEVRVGNIGIPRNHPDYMAVNLAIRILGGEGSNRLHQVLRTARGLTYGAQANFDVFKEGGDFEAETNTRTSATGEVLRLIVDEFWRLQRDRVSERDVGREGIPTGSFPLTIETPNSIAMQTERPFGLPTSSPDVPRTRQRRLRRHPAAAQLPSGQPRRWCSSATPPSSEPAPGIGFGGFETIDIQNLIHRRRFQRPTRRAAGPGRPFRSRDGPEARPGMGQYAPAYSAQTVIRECKALLDRVIAAMGGPEALRGEEVIAKRASRTRDGRRDEASRRATSSTPTSSVSRPARSKARSSRASTGRRPGRATRGERTRSRARPPPKRRATSTATSSACCSRARTRRWRSGGERACRSSFRGRAWDRFC